MLITFSRAISSFFDEDSFVSLSDTFPLRLDVSYNRPKLPACATWNPSAVTFADSSVIVDSPRGIQVTTNNTVYAAGFGLTSVLMWPDGAASPTKSFFGDLIFSHGIFVTGEGDVYADDGANHGRVQKWALNASNSSTAMNVSGLCTGLFMDINDHLYCSLILLNRVLKNSIANGVSKIVTVAGNGSEGSASDKLRNPCGIFVDVTLSLYVADYSNNRIQCFKTGQLNGTAVAGNGATGTIALYHPTGVILDADGYLFISDQGYHRIVGSGPRGFRCVAGCTETSGSAANKLDHPYDLSFDNEGNLYVSDQYNNRIQKFLLATNACGEFFQN